MDTSMSRKITILEASCEYSECRGMRRPVLGRARILGFRSGGWGGVGGKDSLLRLLLVVLGVTREARLL